MPESRGKRYLYWASSTCRRPSRVLARWAKMSRIRALRSRTVTPRISSKARIWPAESSLSKMAMVEAVASISSRTSWALPSPMKEWASGVWRFCRTLAVQKPPAVSSSASSSSKVSSVAVSWSLKQSAFRPTSTARSTMCSSKFRSICYPFGYISPSTSINSYTLSEFRSFRVRTSFQYRQSVRRDSQFSYSSDLSDSQK